MEASIRAFVPRSTFVLNRKIQWFPGHMRKGLRDIGKTLKNTDCILEVHDARIPFSGRNLGFISRISTTKPVILLLNKADLIQYEYRPIITSKLLEQMKKQNVSIEKIFFMDSIAANARNGGYDNKFYSTISNIIEKNKNNFDNMDLASMDGNNFNLLVMGIPNVGKSTVINRLRNVYLNKSGKATITGANAGVTRAVLEKIKISDFPQKIYLFDSPGIIEPTFNKMDKLEDQEAFLKCALCGTISDNVVGKELIADYLLYWLNKNNNLKYMEFFGLSAPSNNITEVLTYGAIHFKLFRNIKSLETGQMEIVPNFVDVAEKFIRHFRAGKFGPTLLDTEILN